MTPGGRAPCRARAASSSCPWCTAATGGPHMADVVAHTGLSVDEIVERTARRSTRSTRSAATPATAIWAAWTRASPRRGARCPCSACPGGSVSIGGAQTGVSASAGPSGWNTIGSTTMDFFDPASRTRRPCCSRATACAFALRGHRSMIEILSSTALATVQDAGPPGSLRWGVGTAGAMDQLALAAGNLLLGNPAGAAGSRCPCTRFRCASPRTAPSRSPAPTAMARLDNIAGAALVGGPGPPARCCAGLPGRWLAAAAPTVRGRRHRRARGAGLAQHPVARGLRRAWRAGRCASGDTSRGRPGSPAALVSAWCRPPSRCRCTGMACPPCGCCRRPSTTASRPPRARPSGPANGRSRRRATATATGCRARRWCRLRRWKCARTASCPA
jgi:hypothetical protein